MPSVYCAVEASVSDRAYQPRETSRQQGRQETKVVGAIQKGRVKQIDEKAMQQNRDNAPEGHAERRLPDCSERKFSQAVPDLPRQVWYGQKTSFPNSLADA